MRIVRYKNEEGTSTYGWMLDDKVGEVQGNIFGEYRRREAKTPLKELRLLAPCEPHPPAPRPVCAAGGDVGGDGQ